MHRCLAAFLLVAVLCAACGKQDVDIYIPFVVKFAGADINCHAEGDVWLTDLRFYVSDVQLIDKDGRETRLRLHDDEIWQRNDLALLDLEHGSAECVNGTGGINQALRGTAAEGEYIALRFTVGVPFELNHLDPLKATVPLDDAAMHWHWRGGYKFLRAGIRSADDSYWVHLGSTGCEGTIQNITHCSAPNRVTVQIDDLVPGRDGVVVDLAELVAPDALDDGTASDCSSGPSELSCVHAFDALGLDHATGEQSGAQRIFSRLAIP